jgi:hypothetical protein
MPLFVFITLFTGLATSYLFKRSQDEIGYLAGVMTSIIFIISLVFAPWPIQLGMLVIVLVSSNKLLKKD